MTQNRTTNAYIEGVNNFLDIAERHSGDKKAIRCPCAECHNLSVLTRSKVKWHLYRYGIDESYTRWIWHGEDVENSSSSKTDRVEKENSFEDEPRDYEEDMVYDAEDRFTNCPDQFESLLEDANTPLYNGCTEFTKLSALVQLWNLKVGGGWTNRSFTLLLELVNKMLPKNNNLPTSVYEAKKTLCSLGMEYIKIHACPNDCVLYRKENEDLDKCPTCLESRWKKGKEPSENRSGVPAKVLWYIPPIPQFKRMFRNLSHSKNLAWHKDREIFDDKLRHPADSPQWKTFDMKSPEFSTEKRNLRLGLSADGINPHSNLSSKHSSWPVVLVIYNLPPWLCMKRKFVMLTLLISGPKQPGNDIDVYLAPLIDDLKMLWETGVIIEDAFRGDSCTLRAMLMWTINDFPAYGNLCGCVVKGHKGCPICSDDTYSLQLKHRKTTVYPFHRRFLPRYHPYRSQKKQFYGQPEFGNPPRPLTGEQVFQRVKNLKVKFGKGKRAKDDDDNYTIQDGPWKKKSIFFELPYWQTLLVRHNLDVMHIEKNVCEAIIGTLLDIPGKTKDGINARKDLHELKIRENLTPVSKGNRTFLPPAKYTLSRKEK